MTDDKTPTRLLAATLDRLVDAAERGKSRFRDLAKAAGLNPAHDFVGASLRDVDFRDEDLRGFDFSNADLTGADFRRANVRGVRFYGATLDGAIGIPKRLAAWDIEPDAIFFSYREASDTYPSRLIRYFVRELHHLLMVDGVSNTVIWRDDIAISPGDDWHAEIARQLHQIKVFIAVLTNNYVKSPWLQEELRIIASSNAKVHLICIELEPVLAERVPEPLRKAQTLPLYHRKADGTVEMFIVENASAKNRRTGSLDAAMRLLASLIGDALQKY